MGDLKFILGFVAGWIATTEEGRKTANQIAEKAAAFVKENISKANADDQAN